MLIDGKKIAEVLRKQLKKDFSKLKKRGKKAKLVTILIGQSPQQLSFVKIKKNLAKKIGVLFEFNNLKTIPSFEVLIKFIKNISDEQKNSAIIIQQPLPSQLKTDSVYDFIDEKKEIESHKLKSTYLPPIGLAVFTLLKYVYLPKKTAKDLFIDKDKDFHFFKKILKNKKIVLIGRGLTGGRAIAKALSYFKISYLQLHSQTPSPERYLKEADIIITAVGKKVVFPEMLKPGVVLINAGLRKEGKSLKGDYDETEIKNIASFYTPTPGGLGPIDVIYLYKNLLEAMKK